MRESWWKKRVCDSGYKWTSPRRMIIDILRNTDRHLSAEEIYVTAIQQNPSIGLTTVYRTLELFSNIGIIQKNEFGDGKIRYELFNNRYKKDHHHHLICIRCKAVIDYNVYLDEELELMYKTEKALSHKYHFKIMNHTISFQGLCSACQKNEE